MRFSTLIVRSLRHYWRTNLAVIGGVGVAVAVLTGALIVGDSVRGSLRDLALERIGRTEFAITAPLFIRDTLAHDLTQQPEFEQAFGSAVPLVALEGLVTHQESARRASDVQVYGVDERFWTFHGLGERVEGPAGRDAFLSPSLAAELGVTIGDTLLVRIEKPAAIPAESLYGRKDEAGRTVRLTIAETLDAPRLGEFSLRPQQGSIRAIFAPLDRLQIDLDLDGRVNAVLTGSERDAVSLASVGRDPDERTAALLQAIDAAFALDDGGVSVRWIDACRCLSVSHESGVIGAALENAILNAADRLGLDTIPILTYLANTIRSGDREIPYSLVTALDLGRLAPEIAAGGDRPAIVLNDWAGRDLGITPGAPVELDYYYWLDEGRLETRTASFTLGAVVALAGAAADPDLTPDYPGITDAEDVSSWDPPFPMDLSRIRETDEDYWDDHRTTPKGFIDYDSGARLWGTRHGHVTAIRLVGGTADAVTPSDAERFGEVLRDLVNPLAFGVALQPVRAQSLAASQGATDFGEYFAYFSAFLVASALLLAVLFFRLGIDQRLREIGALRAIGFDTRRVRTLFLAEGLVLSASGTLLGLPGAVAYGWTMMFGLRTWWVDAVGTTALALHLTPVSLMAGGAAGVVIAAAAVATALRAVRKASPRTLLAGVPSSAAGLPGAAGRSLAAAGVCAIAGCILLGGAALGRIPQAAGFFGGGSLLLVAAMFGLAARLRRRARRTLHGHGTAGVIRLGFRNVAAQPARTVLSVALIAFATFVIVSVEAFRRDGGADPRDPLAGTGGYPLQATALLPVYHDPDTPEGRDALNLTYPDGRPLDGVRFARFRVRPGEDASCLNLYRPQNPRILGVPGDVIAGGRFGFQASLATTSAEQANPWLLLDRESRDETVPVIADANSMTYVLQLALGDELVLDAGTNRPVRLRIVAALSDSIFQGVLLMAESRFRTLFPEQEGHRFFLIDAPEAREEEVAALIEDRLADFGVDVRSTADRLASFHRVENTYLSTFQLLGGLGLVLGTLGLGVVLLRNVLERRRELALLRAVGYDGRHFTIMVVAENAALLLMGLGTGTACALLAIVPAIAARGGLPASAAGLLVGVFFVGMLASVVAAAAARRMHLLTALRDGA